MSKDRTKQLEAVNDALKVGNSVNNRKKASNELVLAAQLNQAREIIIALRKQTAEQEQIISSLQNQVSNLEVQNIQRENELLRESHGLKLGQKLERDASGEWWVIEEEKPSQVTA